MSKSVGISRKGQGPFRRIRIFEVGRSRGASIFEVSVRATPDDVALRIAEEAGKFLMSSDISAIWNEEEKKGSIIVGGFRTVGKVEELQL